MNLCLHVTIPGPPKGKGRPRFVNGHVRTDPQTREYEKQIAMLTIREMRAFAIGRGRTRTTPFPLLGPVAVSVLAYYPLTKKHCESDLYVGRGDIDNVVKAALDGLQKAGAIKNDNQVVRLHALKMASINPRVIIEACPITVTEGGPLVP